MSRRPAFDPARLDDELDQLLPPPPTARPPRHQNRVAEIKAEDLSADVAQDDEPLRPARGAGGRPPRRAQSQQSSSGQAVVVAVRIPKPLYDAVVIDLLAGQHERPSYAQIVTWTCEDHRDEVLAEITHAAKLATRLPRGRKLASEVVPLTLRFQPNEREALDDVMARCRDDVGDRRNITRTAAVIAALRVAVKQGVPAA